MIERPVLLFPAVAPSCRNMLQLIASFLRLHIHIRDNVAMENYAGSSVQQVKKFVTKLILKTSFSLTDNVAHNY